MIFKLKSNKLENKKEIKTGKPETLFGIGQSVFKVFMFASFVLAVAFIGYLVYVTGYNHGYVLGQERVVQEYLSYLDQSQFVEEAETSSEDEIIIIQPSPTSRPTQTGLLRNVTWGGPDLWIAVNIRRSQFGVNPLEQRDDLCTIASIRLNELLELGTLDGHEGFGNFQERRPDLAHIFDNYSNVAEFLVAGAGTAEEAVSLWENTLAHRKLLTGGEYVWGCIYAQNSFGVAIAAF